MRLGRVTAGMLLAAALIHGGGFLPTGKSKGADAPQAASAIPFPQMMAQLSVNMGAWGGLNPADKTKAVEAGIAYYKNKDNTAILNPADFYIKKIDEMLAGNPPASNLGLLKVLKILAVMEYDFYNGQNKEELAKEVLGEKMSAVNRMRHQMGR